MSQTTVQWVVTRRDIHPATLQTLPYTSFLVILITILSTFDVGVANTYTPYPGGPCARPRTTQ